MSFTGLCQVCESAEAEHACPQCGTNVCEKHYDRSHGVCVQCATTFGGDDERPDAPGEDDTGPGLGMR